MGVLPKKHALHHAKTALFHKFLDTLHDVGQLVLGEFWIDWEAEDFLGKVVGVFDGIAAAAYFLEALLFV